ncbi:hypothetical protein GM182_00280 [bacterium 3DAC]|nr:hypothetical protein GM182_00280 [bacterium 3DAC]
MKRYMWGVMLSLVMLFVSLTGMSAPAVYSVAEFPTYTPHVGLVGSRYIRADVESIERDAKGFLIAQKRCDLVAGRVCELSVDKISYVRGTLITDDNVALPVGRLLKDVSVYVGKDISLVLGDEDIATCGVKMSIGETVPGMYRVVKAYIPALYIKGRIVYEVWDPVRGDTFIKVPFSMKVPEPIGVIFDYDDVKG